MKHVIPGSILAIVIFYVPSFSLFAQGNIDWEEIWANRQPASSGGAFGWMSGDRAYTGIAYDKFRDVVYVVNPGFCTVGSYTYPCPKIWIWDATSGYPNISLGRDAVTGQGGVLPVPIDTILAATPGWPDSSYGGFNKGQFALYKIAVDDEGRIYACNLVSPAWGECYPGPPPNCDPAYLKQGPFRMYRWDTPSSTPKLVYATLNATHNAIGSSMSSEMTSRRWGDALDVKSKRVKVYRASTQDSVLIDSVRIYVTGGYSAMNPNLNDEIAVFLVDTLLQRPQNRIANGAGGWMDYRLGIKLLSPYANKAGHGLAVTGNSSNSDIWMDHSMDDPRLGTQRQTALPLPQTYTMTMIDSISSNMITGAGLSGPLAYCDASVRVLCYYLITADAQPSGTPNYNTRARVMNVTTPHSIFRQPGLGDTPYLNNNVLQLNGGVETWISDVDFHLEPDVDSGGGSYLRLFVLMSNNGIAAYRQRAQFWPSGCSVPVELRQFTAVAVDRIIFLKWIVERETNNRGFEIQRSAAGADWQSIGFVDGRGTAGDEHRYSFDDPITPEHTNAGRIVYRLKQIDLDGSYEYSPTIEVILVQSSTPTLEQSYPNPVSLSEDAVAFSTIRYRIPSPALVTLRLYSVLGDEIATLAEGIHTSGSYTVRYNTSGLAPGMYFYRLNASGVVRQMALVVVR